MAWTFSLSLFLVAVLQGCLAFNMESVAWKYLSSPAAGFGYQVVIRDSSSLLTSAPLEQDGERRGKVYRCSINSCTEISIPVPSHAVNMSLGLTMTKNPTSQTTMVCGPTIPRECEAITTYNGLCLEIDGRDSPGPPLPASLEECPGKTDIAFLLDGSGSVASRDFAKMKVFVKDLIGMLVGKDTKFAVAQYSTSFTIHLNFKHFEPQTWKTKIDEIKQKEQYTYTAAAIQKVVDEVFSSSGGSRDGASKILIVITDGESNDRDRLPSATKSANRKSIVRFAIGVGSAFTSPWAKAELNTIASLPSQTHVFQVSSFEALHKISSTLQNSIFNIEGSQAAGASLEMEMAQEGFSAAYTPEGGYHIGTVGAFQWKGGFQSYVNRDQQPTFYQNMNGESDSYLGYSMSTARTRFGTFTVVGAPRADHRGQVMVASPGRSDQTLQFTRQIGAYFGAVVCAMDVDGDSYSDLVLVSSPMYTDKDREGMIFICTLTKKKGVSFPGGRENMLQGEAGERSRFGMSLAPLPDLNNDGFNDLAVGAPLEDDGQGSVYIFHGQRGGINNLYSQRIPGSEVHSGMKFFGLSISQSSLDLSGDALPDMAVGSKGAVVLLRSKPIVTVNVEVSFNPTRISTSHSDCVTPLPHTATVCFTMNPRTQGQTARAQVNYTLTLDARRKAPNFRAYFQLKQRQDTNMVTLDQNRACNKHNFFIEACPEDSLNSVHNEVSFSFEGLPSSDSLSPSLLQGSTTTSNHPLDFEINCGSDNNCIDNLKVDFNFTGSSELRVGIDDVLTLTVSMESRDENSYNSRVVLRYPAGLSYRRFTPVQGRVECSSLDSESEGTTGRSECTIDKPIFKTNSKAVFTISYGIDTNSQFDPRVTFSANATSGNVHAPGSNLFIQRDIGVQYSIYVLLSRVEDSTSNINFTAEKNDLQKPVLQSFKVLNFARDFNLTVIIKVPMQLGETDIWVDSRGMQIPGCKRGKDEEATVRDFVDKLKRKSPLDCAVARCGVFTCSVFVRRDDSLLYSISGNISSGWIEQIGLTSGQFSLTSTATLDYDRDQYIYYSQDSKNNPPIQKVETYVEVFPKVDLTKEIVGGSLGGLVLLALITAALYKAGFFKSQYKQMMENSGDPEGADPEHENTVLEENI
ncbi:integrin alpha-D-like isoform X2 [Hypomesus transpacificus]|nr:integrin alpha-D-like isoform X2 [Hypomesus transpacificus]XP_046906668.1 integrin alpha-D-like isoform X2 [Hypomesus transpacificus]